MGVFLVVNKVLKILLLLQGEMRFRDFKIHFDLSFRSFVFVECVIFGVGDSTSRDDLFIR